MFEIPEPPPIISKIDNRSSIESGSGITIDPKPPKSATNKLQQQYQQSHSSIIFEHENASNAHEPSTNEMTSTDVKSAINNLKNIIQKQQSVSIEIHLIFLRRKKKYRKILFKNLLPVSSH